MKTQAAIVVVSCHFKKKNMLCDTTIMRLEKAFREWGFMTRAGNDALLVVTGNVPYELGAKTLSDLMRGYLISKGVPESHIITGEGVGIFSEARNVVTDIKKRLPDCKVLTIVSSDWYFIPGYVVWDYFASKHGLGIIRIDLKNTGGAKTRRFYRIYGTLVQISFAFHLNGLLEKFMAKLQGGRKESFKFDGCG